MFHAMFLAVGRLRPSQRSCLFQYFIILFQPLAGAHIHAGHRTFARYFFRMSGKYLERQTDCSVPTFKCSLFGTQFIATFSITFDGIWSYLVPN